MPEPIPENAEISHDDNRDDMDEGLNTRYYEPLREENNDSFIAEKHIQALKTIVDNSKAD